MYILFISGNV